MKSAVDKNTSVFLDGDLSHAETQRRREGGSPASAIPFDRSSWKRVRLGDLVAQQIISMGRGNVISKETIESDPGTYPVFSSSATGDGIIGHYARYMFDDERISWSIDGGGRFFYHPASRYSVTNVSGWIKVHKPGEIHTCYLYLVLDAEWQKKHFDYQTKAHPSVIKNEYIIAYPDIDTQNKIVAAISSCDDCITAIQALIAKYEAIKKATVNLLLALRGHWRQIRLGDIGDVLMCKRILKSQTSTTGDVPFYKIGTFGKQPDAFISRTLFEDFKRRFSYPKVGDVLLSAAGTIGRTVVFNGEDAYFQDSNIVWIDNNERIVTNSFLSVLYGQMYWQTENGGTVSRLYNVNIRNTNIVIPPVSEQKRIGAILDSIDGTISGLKSQLAKSQDIKQGMMSYFFG